MGNIGIGAIIVGLILLLFHVLFLYCIFGYIKRIIVCTEKIYAKVTSVEEDENEHKDSKTGKITYTYSYKTFFKYDYNGQTYETTQTYDKNRRYDRGDEPLIKINPHNPKETSGLKGDISTLLGLSLSIPLFAFFDFIYLSILSQVF